MYVKTNIPNIWLIDYLTILNLSCGQFAGTAGEQPSTSGATAAAVNTEDIAKAEPIPEVEEEESEEERPDVKAAAEETESTEERPVEADENANNDSIEKNEENLQRW